MAIFLGWSIFPMLSHYVRGARRNVALQRDENCERSSWRDAREDEEAREGTAMFLAAGGSLD